MLFFPRVTFLSKVNYKTDGFSVIILKPGNAISFLCYVSIGSAKGDGLSDIVARNRLHILTILTGLKQSTFCNLSSNWVTPCCSEDPLIFDSLMN